MLRRSPSRSSAAEKERQRQREGKREAQRRRRKNVEDGKPCASTPISALILCWLDRRYPGRCNLDDLGDVGRLIGDILEASARADTDQ